MRLPTNLRNAAALAVEEFLTARSMTTMTATALRRASETTAMETALRLHYEEHLETRPSLAEVARALAARRFTVGEPAGPDRLRSHRGSRSPPRRRR